MSSPLPLPADFNPETFMLKKETENGVFHESRAGARLAAQLVASGTAQDLKLAEKVLEVVLSCQELDPNDPHYGNFYWMLEDSVVQDLNAAQFCLDHLIPMMLEHADRLTADLQAKIKEAILLGLNEIARLDVLVAYTNICLLDIVNTCLGGELLKSEQLMKRGYQKLQNWMAFTDSNGTAFEFNSPTYTNVCIRALHKINKYSASEEARVRARTAAARLGLSAVLHIHRTTGRWAGPHSRAYHPSVLCETPPELELVQTWLGDKAIPGWLTDGLESLSYPLEVRETASKERHLTLTTYQTDSFALGVASKEYSGQSDVVMLHYHCPGADKPGVLYTRYLTNEKWLGDFYHATDRTKSRNILDEGQFYGVQHANKAIGLYTPGNPGLIHSAKLCLILLGVHKIEEVYLDEAKLEAASFESTSDELVTLASGDIYLAVKPLRRSKLGKKAPMRLVERQGDLVLELYNYLGEEKSFWELGWPGFFFQGKPQCGFYLEVAARADYPDVLSFIRMVKSGSFEESTEQAQTFDGTQERCYSVQYQRDNKRLGIEVDLLNWTLKKRWTEGGELDWPMLESPVAKQNASGVIEVEGARLECLPESAWLYANPTTDTYVAGYHGTTPTSLTLSLPTSTVQVSNMSTGTLIWQKGKVSADALSPGEIHITQQKEKR
ncbi:MAG: hypothetical protein KC422_06775 [Trueperaceae bacterium]|nr:hypothetical protein [Trueperaceae bacterium]